MTQVIMIAAIISLCFAVIILICCLKRALGRKIQEHMDRVQILDKNQFKVVTRTTRVKPGNILGDSEETMTHIEIVQKFKNHNLLIVRNLESR